MSERIDQESGRSDRGGERWNFCLDLNIYTEVIPQSRYRGMEDLPHERVGRNPLNKGFKRSKIRASGSGLRRCRPATHDVFSGKSRKMLAWVVSQEPFFLLKFD